MIRRRSQPLMPIPVCIEPVIRKLSHIRAVLFDVYGTLLVSSSGDISDRRPGPEEELSQLLNTYELDNDVLTLDREFTETVRRVHAIMKEEGIDFPEVRFEEIWDRVLGFKDKKENLDFTLQYELIVNPVYPMPFARTLLKSLQHRNLNLGIISNAQFFTGLLFAAFFGKQMADLGFHEKLIIFSYERGRAKPSSVLFQEASDNLSAMGISPGQVLYVGNDMLNDILPAKNVGFNTGLFAGDERSCRPRKGDDRCVYIKPDLIITSLEQISDCV